MILIDSPKSWPGSSRRWSHIMSDLPGDEGHDELEAFARRAGLRPEWLQHAGRHNEHYDTFGSRVALCVRLGAKLVTSKDLARASLAKRIRPRGAA